MKRYQLVDIWFDGYFLYLTISHEAVAQDMLKAVQGRVTGAQLKLSEDVWRFERLLSKDRVTYEWLLGWLGDNGFEPFATSLHAQVTGYCFRREVDGTEKRSTGTLPFIR